MFRIIFKIPMLAPKLIPAEFSLYDAYADIRKEGCAGRAFRKSPAELRILCQPAAIKKE